MAQKKKKKQPPKKKHEERPSSVARLAQVMGAEKDDESGGDVITSAVWLEPHRIPLKIVAFLLVSAGVGLILGMLGLLFQVTDAVEPYPPYESVPALSTGDQWLFLGGTGLLGSLLVMAGYFALSVSVRDRERPEVRFSLYEQFFKVRWPTHQLIIAFILFAIFATIAWDLGGRVQEFLNPKFGTWDEAKAAIAEEFRPMFVEDRETIDFEFLPEPVSCGNVRAVFPEPWTIEQRYKERALLWRTSRFFYTVKYYVRCGDDGDISYVIDPGMEEVRIVGESAEEPEESEKSEKSD